MSRILIAGIPRAGKTSLSLKLANEKNLSHVSHTDDLIGSLNWSDVSKEVSKWFSIPGAWVIEGVAVPRALRKWLSVLPNTKPCDVVYWLDKPFVQLTPGQEAMGKGCVKVWAEVVGQLQRLGVEIRYQEYLYTL